MAGAERPAPSLKRLKNNFFSKSYLAVVPSRQRSFNEEGNIFRRIEVTQ